MTIWAAFEIVYSSIFAPLQVDDFHRSVSAAEGKEALVMSHLLAMTCCRDFGPQDLGFGFIVPRWLTVIQFERQEFLVI